MIQFDSFMQAEGVPIYQQIIRYVKQGIAAGTIRDGEELPSRRVLSALLAVNLAVMNMLPIPALDGGKIFFLIIDEIAMKLFRKKIPEKYEMAVNTVGFVALMGFMLVVTFNDVFKLFG